MKPHKRSSEIRELRNFVRLDMEQLAYDLSTLDWSGIMQQFTVDNTEFDFDNHAPKQLG